uniref:TRUD domain-containing protein n=1 Tax=Strongyloides papillosus TaxID=174720 RepID=A0A0N5CHB3_STREA
SQFEDEKTDEEKKKIKGCLVKISPMLKDEKVISCEINESQFQKPLNIKINNISVARNELVQEPKEVEAFESLKELQKVKYVLPENGVKPAVRFYGLGSLYSGKGIKTMGLQAYLPCTLTALGNAYEEYLSRAKKNGKLEEETGVNIPDTISHPFQQLPVDNIHYFVCEEFVFAVIKKSFSVIQNFANKLCYYVGKPSAIWNQFVNYEVRHYNSSVDKTLKESPYFTVFLRDPHHLGESESNDVQSSGEYVGKSLELMKTAYKIENQHSLFVRMKDKIEENMERNPTQIINADDPILVQVSISNKFEGLCENLLICEKKI